MSLRQSYGILAPIYDLLVDRSLQDARKLSLSRIHDLARSRILVNGIGTGLDIPLLPPGHEYTGSDITPAMLRIARKRAADCNSNIELIEADSMALPFDDDSFDHVIMHLILAVVPHPEMALKEACRVCRPGGRIFVFDKFLRPGQAAPLRRTINLLIRHIATRTDVVFEDVLRHTPELETIEDRPALARGWFRLIELQKKS